MNRDPIRSADDLRMRYESLHVWYRHETEQLREVLQWRLDELRRLSDEYHHRTADELYDTRFEVPYIEPDMKPSIIDKFKTWRPGNSES